MKQTNPKIGAIIFTPAHAATNGQDKRIDGQFISKSIASQALLSAFMTLAAFNLVGFVLPVNLLVLVAGEEINRGDIINYAPEVWLSLLAFVFGTLIIVITIAAESTPKLIDFFVSDYRSRFYIWIITLSILQNVLLQLVHVRHIQFFDNLIFLNNYLLLPCFIVLAIPYIFYILRYTKRSNVIRRIYDYNNELILEAATLGDSETRINSNQFALFETINQLQDLLQFVQLKEPKGEIIIKLGESVRFYLEKKNMFSQSYFTLGYDIRNDISFKTLIGKFDQIKSEKTFYEKKVLRCLATSYLILIKEGHFDLASLCGNELFETGKLAANLGDIPAADEVIVHFNTQLRHGINHGLKTKEIRNVYNTLFYYGQLMHVFVQAKDEKRIAQFGEYFGFYGKEVSTLSLAEPSFSFLIDAFAVHMKSFLVELNTNGFSQHQQTQIVTIFNGLCTRDLGKIPREAQVYNSSVRLIQICLCLVYLDRNEQDLSELIICSMLRDLALFNNETSKKILVRDCEVIREENENFWEDTDEGNKNIYYSDHKHKLPDFIAMINSKFALLEADGVVV